MKHKSFCFFTSLFILFSLPIGVSGQLHKSSVITKQGLSLPEKTFESFWKTFEDNYAFFKLRNIDWKKSYADFRTKISSTISDDSLFVIFTNMVTPFQDEHINIYIPDKKEFTVTKPSRFLQEFPNSQSQTDFWNMVDTTLAKLNFSTISQFGPLEDNKPLFYIAESSDFGYIRSLRCYVDSKTENSPKKDAKIAATHFDTILRKFQDKKAIILDIRMNEGGNDEFAYAIANRFVKTKTIGHYKQTRKGGYEDFNDLKPFYLTPPKNKSFTKSLVLLTNDQTASAADVLALISKELTATSIGEPTSGIFSDMYAFELPNKWIVTLSNQKYFSAKMVCYESLGVPVDFPVKNSSSDLSTMLDPVLKKAIELLNRQTK
jgi:carboxyl-terminal processing protease